MKKIVIIIVLVMLWNYSNAQSSYFPVNKGMTWTYAYGKDLYRGTPYEHYETKVEILGNTKIIGGKEYFICQTSSGNKETAPTIITNYFRFGNDGVLFTKMNENAKEITTIESTPKVGDTHESLHGGTSKVLDLNATIKTPVATYKECLLIETSENQTTSRAYYQKDIGLIATTIVVDESEKTFIYLMSSN